MIILKSSMLYIRSTSNILGWHSTPKSLLCVTETWFEWEQSVSLSSLPVQEGLKTLTGPLPSPKKEQQWKTAPIAKWKQNN